MTMGADMTLESDYEEDGNRIILRGTPQGNLVMTREGGSLKGMGMDLRRLPAK